MSEEKTLTAQQLKAIDALLINGSIGSAAAAAGCNARTLYRWRADPAFVAALREAESEAVAALSRNLAGLGELAATALRAALADGQKMTIRLRASDIVIGNLLKVRELVEVEQQIAELKAEIARINAGNPGGTGGYERRNGQSEYATGAQVRPGDLHSGLDNSPDS